LSDDTLSRCAETEIPIHVHVAEGEEDATLHKKEFGMSALSRLNKFELLRENSLLSHCLLIDDEDLDLIRDRNCRVVFNPQSNMNNGAGIPNHSRFKNAGIKVNLGNDGYGADLTRDMRVLLLTQHLLYKDPTAFGTSDLFDIVFKNNAEYASHILGTKIGKIAEGYGADLVIYEYDPPTPLTAENFMDHYYFSIMENCKPKAVLVDGRWLMKDEKLCTLNEEKVNSESKKQCEDFWKRV
jgi:cytosine/adenosine deaminase-related metal-dependent hydrolase